MVNIYCKITTESASLLCPCNNSVFLAILAIELSLLHPSIGHAASVRMYEHSLKITRGSSHMRNITANSKVQTSRHVEYMLQCIPVTAS